MFHMFREFFAFKNAVPALSLSIALLAIPLGSHAQEVDMDAVRASLKTALADAAALSREQGPFVLPMRTNAELAEISFWCEVILSEDDLTTMVPPICSDVEAPVNEFDDLVQDFAFNKS